MATFYVLPPRSLLEQALADVIGRLLPGLPIPADGWDGVLVHLAARSGWANDLFLVPRDDLPDGEPVADALRTHFGAEPGDRVVEVPTPRTGSAVRAWMVGPPAVSAPSAGPYNDAVPATPLAAVG